MREQETVVGRLRIRAPRRAGSPFASAPAGLDRVRLRPSGLGPSAVLMVRRLADPRPGTVRLGGPDAVPALWQRAVTAELDDELQGAARPWLEAVPAAANAVLFADHAELLAAMAADWVSGVLGNHWWWRLMRARWTSTVDAVGAAWRGYPRAVPPALGLLAARGQVVAFGGALSEEVAAQVVAEVVAVQGAMPTVEEPTSSEPPWAFRVPEAGAPGLAAAQRLLLGVGLALHRMPAAASRPEFLSAATSWHVREQAVIAAADSSAPFVREAEPERDHKPGTAVPVRRGEIPVGQGQGQDTAGGKSRVAAPAQTEPSAYAEPAPEEAVKPSRAAVHLRHVRPAAEPPRAPTTDLPLPAQPIDSELGGFFFLLNLALYLRLYGDFTAPAQPGLTLHPFELIARVGRELLSEPSPADPMWSLLDALAGDEPTEFRPPTEWRVPPEWLEPFPSDEPWLWSSARGRLRVRHPAGFDVLDTASDATTSVARVRREFPGVRLRRRSLPPRPVEPLRRWVAALTGYARARLALALDCPPETAGDLLGRLSARISSGPAHVDVRFALAALPIEVRLAGLDRDPGWVPAAGRTVTFQFD